MQTDQQKFDEQVNVRGKLLLEILAGVGIFAAVTLSVTALVISAGTTPQTAGGTQASGLRASTLPASATVMIDHVTRGCHTLAVNGAAPGAPSATLHIAAGGLLHVQNNDVMPQRLVRVAGPHAQFTAASMSHMGARSSVTFPTAGTYSMTTTAGEDYASGIHTIGPDNTLRIKVIVGEA
ncbi:MAG: hypothetical protein QOE11_2873 [Solirubrobacteraceae bacterium]|jgi:hypothetical protein|nr:hypothetical protein [Solirubrobacteraceae bacterium]